MKRTSVIVAFSLSLLLCIGCAGNLRKAAYEGDLNSVTRLLEDQGSSFDKDEICISLHWAALGGRRDVVNYLLDSGRADVNCTYPGEQSKPILYANDKEMIALLIARGADVSAKNLWGGSALIRESRKGDAESAKLLIAGGADLDGAIAYHEGDLVKNPKDSKAKTGLVLLREIKKQLSPVRAEKPAPAEPVQSKPAILSDVDEIPSWKTKPNRNAYAVVIGIEKYRRLPSADFATSDARLVGHYLSRAMGYPEENMVILINENASFVDLVKYLEQWLANHVEKGSTVFVYYSGHGAPNPKTGDAYLVPYDGDPSFIAQTGYPLKRLYESLGKLPAKEITIALDSCFSGAGGRSVLAEGARPLVMNLETAVSVPKNMTVMAAASGAQISSTYREKGHGLFTYFMLKGIKNEGVLGPDGSIMIGDLFGYVKPQVERIARRQYNNEQTPQLIGHKVP